MIRARHLVLKSLRRYFDERGYVEVETPYLGRCAAPDPYIDPLRVFAADQGPFYLHTSPEMGMKKLLALGLSRIFQICRVFRVEEFEEHHSTEFTMLEWYRPGTYVEAMEETEELIRSVDRELNSEVVRYADRPWKVYGLRDLFLEMTTIDPFPLSGEELRILMGARGVGGLKDNDAWEDLFFKLLIQEIEPRLQEREKGPFFLKDWPASLTAMAKKKDDCTVERFELYMGGLEIANGYSELLDREELRMRMVRDNEERLRLRKETFPLDEAFLDAVSNVHGPVAGVSVGVDRLLMALLGKESIGEVLPDRLIPILNQSNIEAPRKKRRRCTVTVHRGADDEGNEDSAELELELPCNPQGGV